MAVLIVSPTTILTDSRGPYRFWSKYASGSNPVTPAAVPSSLNEFLMAIFRGVVLMCSVGRLAY